jgi:hypothetical protein
MLLTDEQVTEAFEQAAGRVAMPTTLDTEMLRLVFTRSMRERVHVSARVTLADFATVLKESVDQVLTGTAKQKAIAAMVEKLNASKYTPETGFPGDLGRGIPAARPGSITDISSFARLNLVIETESALAAGKIQQLKGNSQIAKHFSPAWELVRLWEPEKPRDWPERWEKAGGPPALNGKLIAPKDHEVWHNIGSSRLFDDALDVSYPPFWFNSSGSLNAVPRSYLIAHGAMTKDGAWSADYAPSDSLEVSPALPAPEANTKRIDPEIQKGLDDALRMSRERYARRDAA